MSTLSERIEATQKELVGMKEKLLVLTQELEDTPEDESKQIEVEAMTALVEGKQKHLDTLNKAEAALAEKVREGNKAPAIGHSTQKNVGELWVKQATVDFLAYAQRKAPEQVMAERYPNDMALKTVAGLTKAAVPVATTYTAGWAQELTRNDVRGFIDVLTPTSVAAALATRSMMLNFDGFDTITIPRRAARAAGQTLGGAFVGEGGAIPLGRMAIASSTISRYKMGVISTFTKELAQRSTPTIEAVIRQAILDDMSMMLDSVFLGAAAAVAGVQPAGILNGVTGTAGTAGGGVDAVIGDIKAALGALAAAGLGVRPVLLVNSQDALSVGLLQSALGEFVFQTELGGNRLLGVEVIRSLNVTAGQAIVIDASALATAFDGPMFDVSDVASVIEADAGAAAPTHATGTAGALGTAGQVPRGGGIPISGASGAATTGGVGRSLWQTNALGIKCIQPVSWALIQPNAVVNLTGLTW